MTIRTVLFSDNLILGYLIEDRADYVSLGPVAEAIYNSPFDLNVWLVRTPHGELRIVNRLITYSEYRRVAGVSIDEDSSGQWKLSNKANQDANVCDKLRAASRGEPTKVKTLEEQVQTRVFDYVGSDEA